ncbi:glycosyltransferase [Roseivivax sp. CAU 1761]
MPDRVAFVLPHFGHGGAEGVVLRLLQGLDRARFAPLLVLQRRRGELLDRVPADVPVIALRHPGLPGCIPDLARTFAREEVALAVTLTNAAALYCVPAARLAGRRVRTLVTEHTPFSVFLAEAKFPRLRRAATRRILPRATLTGGPLDAIGRDLAALLGPAAPPFVALPNPVVDRVTARRPAEGRAREIVSVGRLAPEKRFDLLIDAFALLQRTHPEARLTIHGEGSERAALTARIRGHGLADRVRLAGYSADLDAAYDAADLFVCTSRREGLGNAIIEAMARSLPVVSVDCPFGPRHLLRGGRAGKLLEDDAPAAIAGAMAELLDDPALRARYAAAGIEVARDYQVGHAVAAYEAAFRRALAPEGAGRDGAAGAQ